RGRPRRRRARTGRVPLAVLLARAGRRPRGECVMAVSDQVMRHLHRAEGGSHHAEATFLPDPEPRPRHYTIISVDDHLIEPAHLFEGRVPAALADRAPHVVTLD